MVADRRRARFRAALLLAVATSGCATILGGNEGILDEDAGVDGGLPDTSLPFEAGGGNDVAQSDGALPDAPKPDAATDASGGCSGDAGPGAVSVGRFCIDGTEVTNAQYQVFLTAKGADVSGQPATCAWNASYTPAPWPPPAAEMNRPVVLVDWCDAYAFCAWTGKRLCGAIDGGATDFGDYMNASASQWFAACSHADDGQHAYPYGDAYAPAACNGADTDGGGVLVDVGSMATCVGGYAGVFDMSGNAREWEDSCSAADAGSPQLDICRTRGGGANDDGGVLLCAHPSGRARNSTADHTGFRCCSP